MSEILTAAKFAIALAASALLWWRPRAFLYTLFGGALLWNVVLAFSGTAKWYEYLEPVFFSFALAFVIRVWLWVYETKHGAPDGS